MRLLQQAGSVSNSTRLICVGSLGVLWTCGYVALGSRAQHTNAIDPTIRLDFQIPFIAWAVWPYLLGVVGIVLPAAVIRTPKLFVRTTTAYALVILVSFLCFFLIPTNASGFRPYGALRNMDRATAAAFELLYSFDRTTNLMPSMHISLATLAMLACAKAYPRYRLWIYGAWLILAASVCLVKQHAVLDVAAGALLAVLVFRLSRSITARLLSMAAAARPPQVLDRSGSA
jgi:membrane-associated phospholipid phosphatase